jgi:hypothetical protein
MFIDCLLRARHQLSALHKLSLLILSTAVEVGQPIYTDEDTVVQRGTLKVTQLVSGRSRIQISVF